MSGDLFSGRRVRHPWRAGPAAAAAAAAVLFALKACAAGKVTVVFFVSAVWGRRGGGRDCCRGEPILSAHLVTITRACKVDRGCFSCGVCGWLLHSKHSVLSRGAARARGGACITRVAIKNDEQWHQGGGGVFVGVGREREHDTNLKAAGAFFVCVILTASFSVLVGEHHSPPPPLPGRSQVCFFGALASVRWQGVALTGWSCETLLF